MSIREITLWARDYLSKSFLDANEVKTIVGHLTEEILGCPSFFHITEPDFVLEDELVESFKAAISRISKGEPMQYVLGYEEFYGRKFNVNPSVLIPRPETEELCQRAIALKPSRVLDLCTGSGCIAWTLALEVPNCEVYAVDLSEDALQVAQSQFQSQEKTQDYSEDNLTPKLRKQTIRPRFFKADVLSQYSSFDFESINKSSSMDSTKFDLIISNPPYVRESEKVQMRKNVLDYEPSMALFVPDKNPLIFYRAIFQWAEHFLKPSGTILMEINEALSKETEAIFSPKYITQIHKDIFDKPRILYVKDVSY